MTHGLRTILPALLLAGLAGCSAIDTRPEATAAVRASPEQVPEIMPGVLQGYLPKDDQLDSKAFVRPAPAEDSARQTLDTTWSKEMLPLRGSARWDLAIRDADLAFPAAASTFSCALGIPVTEADTPALYMLLRRTLADLGLATYSAKNAYQRARPFMINGEPVCTPEEEDKLRKDGSYPSGHTAVGWGWALLLSELAPDRAEAILARGRAFGESRNVCNVHWYSDVVAGRVVGSAAFGETIDSRLGQLEFDSGYPTTETVEKLYDELDLQRAVQAYLWALPMASYGAMADAHWALGADNHTVVVVDELAQPRNLALTANQDTVYMSGVLDLREGPVVMELPQGLLGTPNNLWQQPLVDLGGPFSPEQNRGGKFLILPPGYDGPLPATHHHIAQSDSNIVVFYLRAIPQTRADIPKLVELIKSYRQYPLKEAADPPETRFASLAGKDTDFLTNEGLSYFKTLARYVNENPLDDPERPWASAGRLGTWRTSQPGRFVRSLFRAQAAGRRAREKLGTDHAGQGLVRVPAPVRAGATLLRQDLGARRRRKSELSKRETRPDEGRAMNREFRERFSGSGYRFSWKSLRCPRKKNPVEISRSKP